MSNLAEILQQVPDSFLAAEMRRRDAKRHEPQCLAVLNAVAIAFDAKPEEIRRNHTRRHSVLLPRHAAMVIMRGMGLRLTCIARFFGMNHAAAMFAVKRHHARMQSPSYAARYNAALANSSLKTEH